MKYIAATISLLALSGCVVEGPAYPQPYPAYAPGAVAYDYYPYTYYYGHYGTYPAHYDAHRHYNWGYWNGNGHVHNEGRGVHGNLAQPGPQPRAEAPREEHHR